MDEMSNPHEHVSHFNEDYWYFTEFDIPPEKSDRDAGAIWELLSLERESLVLELGCGYGRITNRLAEKGARVTGLDASLPLLKKAEADAVERGVDVEYKLGDMRSLPWRDRFDAVVLWYTTFGYFDDENNERVLREAARSLGKGGRLLIDQGNRFAWPRDTPSFTLAQRSSDLRIQVTNYDPLVDRANIERIVIRDGSVRRTGVSIRYYSFIEYFRMLKATGFDTIEAYGQQGEDFTPNGPRLVVVATK
ncbi:class I SAM-dependent methyltransferase [Mesorhizobium sp.]|uniref:class I SAM-dependent methyltransferase n=1 Tax=Mesorhizobium sp. TaxID=1871066 RepID=UPI0011F753F3|nr:class I SAM-dependent methyltransferase [Mesorhizobium sp.]TIN74504.1 MAG: class I SAM-dependent methyltransferase [Mesorhizobium sp.]TIO64514.1 MAG: class I SAM-dependent methyltransferase [Mesorhizobium sp.]TJV86212.1 MAG: class I SAM-dependent methyltransferase [Mesorhizobium sp.]